MAAMSERVCLGAAEKQLGVSGGDIRRAGYTKVTTARLGALAWAAFLDAPAEPGPDG
jgi:hypothetical protein